MVLYFEDVKVAKVTVEILSVPAVNILMFGVKVAASYREEKRYSKNNQKMLFLLLNLLDA